MHSGVGAARDICLDLRPQDLRESVLEIALNGSQVRLSGEPVKGTAVVGEVDPQVQRDLSRCLLVLVVVLRRLGFGRRVGVGRSPPPTRGSPQTPPSTRRILAVAC